MTSNTQSRNDLSIVGGSAGWQQVPCPLCDNTESVEVFTSRNTRYGIDVTATVVRCTTCGMLRTDPQPDDDQAAALYRAGEYYTHSSQADGRSAAMKRWLRTQTAAGYLAPLRAAIERSTDVPRFSMRFAVRHFPLGRGMRLLDVGCGDGGLLELFAGLGVEGVGLEPDPSARDAAKTRGVDTVESFEECDGHFDRVILRHVLEHVAEPVPTLKQAAELLSEDGLVMVSVPNALARQAEVFGPHWEGWDLPRHRWHFTASSLTQLCVKAGLRVLHLRSVELHSFAAASQVHRDEQGFEAVDYVSRHCGALERKMKGAELVAVLEKQPKATTDPPAPRAS